MGKFEENKKSEWSALGDGIGWVLTDGVAITILIGVGLLILWGLISGIRWLWIHPLF